MADTPQEKPKEPETKKLTEIVNAPQKSEPVGCGEICPQCGSANVDVYNVRDVAFSIHYIHDEADFTCNKCNNSWSGTYGYRGLA